MGDGSSCRVVVEGRILPASRGYLFEAQGRLWALALEEDPSGFVGMQVCLTGAVIDRDVLAVADLRRCDPAPLPSHRRVDAPPPHGPVARDSTCEMDATARSMSA